MTEPPGAEGTWRLGADTLCWHQRLEFGSLTLDEALAEAAGVGCDYVQLSLHHARHLDDEGLAALSRKAADLGLALLASGDFVGTHRAGDVPEVGVERVHGWLHRARIVGSPVLRVASGFYRAELLGVAGAIEAERRYVVEVLRGAREAAAAAGIRVLLENHSDFSSDEFLSIVDEVGRGEMGVFLDVINPISAFEQPVDVVRRLAPLSPAGHVKDFVLESFMVRGGYHRSGFAVHWRYPGEGSADLDAIVAALANGRPPGPYFLAVEGLDNRHDVADQQRRLATSLARVRRALASSSSELLST